MGSADCGRDKEELVGGGEVGRLLGGPMIGVNFAATLQKSSKLSASKMRSVLNRIMIGLAFFYAFPKPILVDFSQAYHSSRVSPSNEVCFFKLVHESLFTSIYCGGQKKLITWRCCEM